jgi:hypothetical protein
MFDALADLIRLIWQTDTDVREGSTVGQSPVDRSSGRVVAWICGTAIFLCLVASVLWWWFLE